MIGTARNAILVIVCGAIGYVFENGAGAPFKLIGAIPPGLPAVQLPPFSIPANESLSGNDESFGDMVASMGSGIIVVPLIALMENIAICKAFGNYLLISQDKNYFYSNQNYKMLQQMAKPLTQHKN